MPRRVTKFLFAALLVGLSCYLFHYNRENIKVVLGPSNNIEAPLAVVLLSVFFFGACVVGIFALGVGLKYSFTDWQRSRRERQRTAHRDFILRGRELFAIESYAEAASIFLKIVTQDPDNIPAWLMLIEVYEKQGEIQEALDVLNQARLQQKSSVELLVKGAEINEKLGNITAAHDNLTLVLNQYPGNAFLLVKLADYAQTLEQYEQAARYVAELVRNADPEEQHSYLRRLADLELNHLKSTLDHASPAYKTALESLTRKHRDYPPALAELAIIERNSSDLNKAAKHWTKGYTLSNDVRYLESLASMWLAVNEPNKAISAVEHAVLTQRSNHGDHGVIDGHLLLVSLYLYLEMLDDAEAELERLANDASLPSSVQAELTVLRARIMARRGKPAEVSSALLGLIDDQVLLPSVHNFFPKSKLAMGDSQQYWQEQFRLLTGSDGAPPPQLSTP